MKKVLFLIITSVMLLGLIMKGAFGYFSDEELSAGSTFSGWIPVEWIQTLQEHFQAGVRSNVNITSSPGDVKLDTQSFQTTIATDDFESHKWNGGSGWLHEWWHEGKTDITKKGTPHSGTYHLRLRNSSGYADRAVDLAGYTNVHLQFWAKADSFEGDEFAECLVSPDDNNWTTVQTWVDGDDDNVYRFYDIDLSGFTMTSEFWIAFDAEMSDNKDYFYVDDVVLVYTTSQYHSSGSIASQVLDTEISGAIWSELSWSETIQSGTDITLEVRASDTQFAKSDVTPSWVAVGGTSPVESGLPAGRYMQWRVTLSTSESDNSPVLHDATINYY